jgi:hypothetical protein
MSEPGGRVEGAKQLIAAMKELPLDGRYSIHRASGARIDSVFIHYNWHRNQGDVVVIAGGESRPATRSAKVIAEHLTSPIKVKLL